MAKRGVKIDRLGQKFNMLTIIKSVPRLKKTGKRERTYWICRCDCGSIKRYVDTALVSGRTKSCGCYQKSINHGLSKNREYRILSGMKNRCYNKNDENYKYYGGRGISICERWLESYFNFIADMGKSPSVNHSIDRIDVNGNYEPDNCRWATAKEQANNTRRNINISLYGITQTLTEWSEEFRVSRSYLSSRINDYNESILIIADRFKYNPKTRKCEIPFSDINTGIVFEYNGVKKNITEWSKEFGCSYSYLNRRLRKNEETISDIAKQIEYNPNKPGCSNLVFRKKNYLVFKYKGQEKLLTEWAKVLGTTYCTLYGQILVYGKDLAQVIQERNLKLAT